MHNQPPNPSRRKLFTWLTDRDAAAAIGAEAGRPVRTAREAGQELSQALQEATDQVNAAVNAPEPEPPLPANLRTDLIDLLVATPGMDDPEGRKALLYYIGFASLIQTVDLHGAPLTVASRLLSAVAGSGKTALSQFLTAWETWPGVGEARQGQLAAMAPAVAGLSEAAVQGELVVETPESLAELQTQYARLADAVAGLQTADGTDRQLLVEIAGQLQQFQGMIAARLPQAQTAAEKADMRHLSGLTQTLIALFVGATGAALYEAFIGDTVYPALKEWVMGLLEPAPSPPRPCPSRPRRWPTRSHHCSRRWRAGGGDIPSGWAPARRWRWCIFRQAGS